MDKTSADSCFSTINCYYSEYYISFADNYKGLIKGSQAILFIFYNKENPIPGHY